MDGNSRMPDLGTTEVECLRLDPPASIMFSASLSFTTQSTDDVLWDGERINLSILGPFRLDDLEVLVKTAIVHVTFILLIISPW